jgi:hypothetical protein
MRGSFNAEDLLLQPGYLGKIGCFLDPCLEFSNFVLAFIDRFDGFIKPCAPGALLFELPEANLGILGYCQCRVYTDGQIFVMIPVPERQGEGS